MLNKFNLWYNDVFKRSSLYIDMVNATEDSPWHRETNIGIHTDMVVMEYLRTATNARGYPPGGGDILGALACAFHDVGKPGAMEHKWKESRGDYKSFNGHELLSARLWEEYAVTNWKQLTDWFSLSAEDIYRVGVLIEYHKPWDIKKPVKLNNMALTLLALDIDKIFKEVVIADTWGRISDDYLTNRAKVQRWCFDFSCRCDDLRAKGIAYKINPNPENRPVMYMPIAASGSGKSTYASSLEPISVYSLDAMRHEFYGDDYAEAFRLSVEDKEFHSACNNAFHERINKNKDVVIDNINISKKRRAMYINYARQHKFHVVALLFPVSLHKIVARQASRPDKTVPEEAVRQQYQRLQLPQYGEFDEVRVISSNI